MQTRHQTVGCKSRPFRLVLFDVDPAGRDRALVDRAVEAARSQGGTTRSPGGRRRTRRQVFNARYLGALSELLLARHLQRMLGEGHAVTRPPFSDYDTHVDLTVAREGAEVHLEVRGSFPYAGLAGTICTRFDVIGPYSTSFKRGEAAKDFYLRTLINERDTAFSHERPHTVIFAGGAEHALFGSLGYDTDFDQTGARYRAIKPIARARDADEIVELIRRSLA